MSPAAAFAHSLLTISVLRDRMCEFTCAVQRRFSTGAWRVSSLEGGMGQVPQAEKVCASQGEGAERTVAMTVSW